MRATTPRQERCYFFHRARQPTNASVDYRCSPACANCYRLLSAPDFPSVRKESPVIMNRRVGITGVGAVSPAGPDSKAHLAGLLAARSFAQDLIGNWYAPFEKAIGAPVSWA